MGQAGQDSARHCQRTVGPAALSRAGRERRRSGLALHFFIAFSAAVVYYAASRKLAFLTAAGGALGYVLWHRGIHVHELGGRAVVGLSQEQGSVFTDRRLPSAC